MNYRTYMRGLMLGPTFANRLAKRYVELIQSGSQSFNVNIPENYRVPWEALPENVQNLISFTFARLETEIFEHVVRELKEQMPSFEPADNDVTDDEVEDAPPA